MSQSADTADADADADEDVDAVLESICFQKTHRMWSPGG